MLSTLEYRVKISMKTAMSFFFLGGGGGFCLILLYAGRPTYLAS